MSRRVPGANEMSVIAIRIQSHTASAERDLKVKWSESNRTLRGASKNLRKISWGDGTVSGRLNSATRS